MQRATTQKWWNFLITQRKTLCPLQSYTVHNVLKVKCSRPHVDMDLDLLPSYPRCETQASFVLHSSSPPTPNLQCKTMKTTSCHLPGCSLTTATSNRRFRIYSVPPTGADWVSTGIQTSSPPQPKVTQQRYGFLKQCPFVASELPPLYSPHIDFLQGERLWEAG